MIYDLVWKADSAYYAVSEIAEEDNLFANKRKILKFLLNKIMRNEKYFPKEIF